MADCSTLNPANRSSGRPLSALVLIGFMGAGKSSVGRQLAADLGWGFIDLDDRIVARESRSIPEIFRESGEVAFREMETRALRQVLGEVLAGCRAVVALGGGAYAELENELLIGQAGLPVVFLDAPLSELRERCRLAAEARPLFQDQERFESLYGIRREHYLRATFRVDTTGKQIEAVAREILAMFTGRIEDLHARP